VYNASQGGREMNIPEHLRPYVKPSSALETRDWLYNRSKTKEWWIMLTPLVQSVEIGHIIETRYYDPKDPEKQKDFELAIDETAAIAFFAMKKSRMTLEQFKDCLKVVAHYRKDLINDLREDTDIFVYSSQKDFVPEDPKMIALQRIGENNVKVWAYALVGYFKTQALR
jgi:hypothetical protein